MFKPKKQNNSSSSKYPEGVYFDTYTIEDITVNENNTYDQDINLIAHIKDESSEWSKKFWLAGNHEKEQGVAIDYGTNKTVGRNGSYYIKKFIEAAGVDPLTALNSKGDDFTDEAKADLIGRSLICAEYPTENPKYKNFWKKVTTVEKGANALRTEWLEMFKDKEQHNYVPKAYLHAEQEKIKWSSNEYESVDKHKADFEAEDDSPLTDDMPF